MLNRTKATEKRVAEATEAMVIQIANSTQQMMLAMHGSIDSLLKTNSSSEFDDDSILSHELEDVFNPSDSEVAENQSDSPLHLMPDSFPNDRPFMTWDFDQEENEEELPRLHLMPDGPIQNRSMMDWESQEDQENEPLRFHGLG